MQIPFTTYYILSAVLADGSRQYMAIDQQSGGYPWWTDRAESAQPYADLEKARKNLGMNLYLPKNAATIEVIEVVRTGTVITRDVLASEAKKEALARIERIKKDLEIELSKLETLK